MKVQDLNGGHLGQAITITTANTTATGVLQGFRHESAVITEITVNGHRTQFTPGKTGTTITLIPNQNITATLQDEVTVHE